MPGRRRRIGRLISELSEMLFDRIRRECDAEVMRHINARIDEQETTMTNENSVSQEAVAANRSALLPILTWLEKSVVQLQQQFNVCPEPVLNVQLPHWKAAMAGLETACAQLGCLDAYLQSDKNLYRLWRISGSKDRPDHVWQFIVRAANAAAARRLAAANCGDEGPSVWKNEELSHCEELTYAGPSCVISRN